MIKIFGLEKKRKMIVLYHQRGVSEEKIAVGFQMNNAPVCQEAAITRHEKRTRESFVHVFHLRITECQPNLLHFIRPEKTVDDLNIGAQKGYIL